MYRNVGITYKRSNCVGFFLPYSETEIRSSIKFNGIDEGYEEFGTIRLTFTPGGQGAMLGLPDDDNLGKLLEYVKENDRYLMCVCHGPASFLACKAEPHPYSGYKLACFPDSIDKQTPMIGYLPGVQTWYYGEKLIERGMKILNTAADDMVVEDRKLLSGSSPKALQKLGKLASERLLETYA